MNNTHTISYFLPPISPIKDANGRTTTPSTLIPNRSATIQQVFNMITQNEKLKELTLQVRNATDMRAAKATLLPYVTPCGCFSRRNSKCLLSTSGLVVIDIDHLDSPEEAAQMRQTLFDDAFLCPALVFVSPSGKGVKAFIPYHKEQDAIQSMQQAMQYVEMTYGKDEGTAKGVDTSGKDIVRACFLSHDEGALYREETL